jgi:hypothetical protein
MLAPVGLFRIASPIVGKNVQKADPRMLATFAFIMFSVVLLMRSHFNTQADFVTIILPAFHTGHCSRVFFIQHHPSGGLPPANCVGLGLVQLHADCGRCIWYLHRPSRCGKTSGLRSARGTHRTGERGSQAALGAMGNLDAMGFSPADLGQRRQRLRRPPTGLHAGVQRCWWLGADFYAAGDFEGRLVRRALAPYPVAATSAPRPARLPMLRLARLAAAKAHARRQTGKP